MGGATTVAEYLDFVGNSFIQNTFSVPAPVVGDPFTFTDAGVFLVTTLDGGSSGSIAGLFPGYEMTAIFSGGTGTGTLGGTLDFTGGTLSLYSDNTPNYGVSDGVGAGTTIFGADDGTLIGTFALTFGTGQVNPSGIPNGELTLAFEATSLLAGYWFDALGNDLSSTPSVLSFVTTNASFVANANAALTAEVVCQQNGFNCGTGTPFTNLPFNFLVSNNGQYRMDVAVPEPATLALMGLGLIGLGVRRRKGFQG